RYDEPHRPVRPGICGSARRSQQQWQYKDGGNQTSKRPNWLLQGGSWFLWLLHRPAGHSC
ncbi:MAG: hypothetical protein WAN42_22465, partial [Pseudolabrys sp.]